MTAQGETAPRGKARLPPHFRHSRPRSRTAGLRRLRTSASREPRLCGGGEGPLAAAGRRGPYRGSAFCRAKISRPTWSKIRNPIVRGGHAICAAATIAADTSATSISTSVKEVGPLSAAEPTNWIRNGFVVAAVTRANLSAGEDPGRDRALRGASQATDRRLREAASSRSGTRTAFIASRTRGSTSGRLPIRRATANATKPQSVAIAWELASYSRRRAS